MRICCSDWPHQLVTMALVVSKRGSVSVDAMSPGAWIETIDVGDRGVVDLERDRNAQFEVPKRAEIPGAVLERVRKDWNATHRHHLFDCPGRILPRGNIVFDAEREDVNVMSVDACGDFASRVDRQGQRLAGHIVAQFESGPNLVMVGNDQRIQSSGQGCFGQASFDWDIVGVGDYTGDGTDDILWRNVNTGAVGIYEMTGGVPSWQGLGQAGLTWDVDGQFVDSFVF